MLYTFSTQSEPVIFKKATARPIDNAAAETFFTASKQEKAYSREYTSGQHFRKSMEKYIRFYNEVRPRQTLNYKTPRAFEAAFRPFYRKPVSKIGYCVKVLFWRFAVFVKDYIKRKILKVLTR